MGNIFEQKVLKALEQINGKLDEHGGKLDEHGRKLDEHGGKLDEHGKKLDEQGKKLDEQGKKLDEHSKKLDEHSEILGLHSKMLHLQGETLKEHTSLIKALITGQESLKAEISELRLQTVKEFGEIKEKLNGIEDSVDVLKEDTWENKKDILRLKKTMGMS